MSVLSMFAGMENGDGNGNHLKNVVLVDVSHFAHRVFHGYFKSGEKVNHVSMRYTLLWTILNRFKNFNIKPSTHEIIFCYDGQNYWKKVVAPYYKCRRADRRKDNKDWEGFRESMNSLQAELEEYYPFMILQFNKEVWYNEDDEQTYVSGIEADDVIGVLAKRFSNDENRNVIVMTGDGDFTQLDYLDNLTIINFEGKIMTAEHGCGAFDLLHKIVNGDSKDDISNILMRSDYWATKLDGERQTSAKQLAKKCCDNFLNPTSVLTEEQKERFFENQRIQDFNFVPKDLQRAINNRYDNYILNERSKIRDFLYDLKLNDGLIQDNLVDLLKEMV